MASIQRRGDSYLIQFYDKDGKRRGISLSKKMLGRDATKRAQNIATHVEALNSAQHSGFSIPRPTAVWLDEQGDKLISKLAKVDLIEPINIATLGEFLDDYFESRTDWAPRTKAKHNTTKDYLESFFKRDKLLRDVTEDDADAFHRHLKNKVEAIESDSTVWKHISNARVYFTAAIRRRLIGSNPFTHVKVRKVSGQNFYFVTKEQADAVLEACPDRQWRCLFALARYGGLRIPSEIQHLELSDILWDKHKFLVKSPKTERYTGQEQRYVPIFPKLRPYLEEVDQLAEPGQRYLITITRKPNGELSDAYLRKRMLKIVERAGVVPWPKLFQNLRSTCQTELQDDYPGHKVCKWLGNSETVANKHYLQITEEDFRKAAKGTQSEPEKVMPILMRQLTEVLGDDENWSLEELSEVLGIPTTSDDCSTLLTPSVAAEGLEPPTRGL